VELFVELWSVAELSRTP